MKINKLKKNLQSGKVVIGPFLKLADPAIVEIAGLAGFDFVIIDTEHGTISFETAQNLIRSAEIAGITPIIRVSENSPALILRSLDIGAQGVQVPQVSTKDDAVRAVEATKFFPQGSRGVCVFADLFVQQDIHPKIKMNILKYQTRKPWLLFILKVWKVLIIYQKS